MLSVKLKFKKPINPGEQGTVYVHLKHDRFVRVLSTKVKLYSVEWDAAEEKVKYDVADREQLQAKIDECVCRVRGIIRSLETADRPLSTFEVTQTYKNLLDNKYFVSFAVGEIIRSEAMGSMATVLNYRNALHSFYSFLGYRDVLLTDVSGDLVNMYASYLKDRGIVRNSVSFYMRTLRSLYNKAVRKKYVAQGNPFREVYTGIDRTRKRAVDEHLIHELYHLDLPEYSSADLSRDLFIFSYCTRGMSFVDVVNLRKNNIRGGKIVYTRHKTGQELNVRIESEARMIIDKYAVYTRELPFVFPILRGRSKAEDFRLYRAAINEHNRMLKKLSSFLSENCSLTSYVARHSWATAARNHNVPINIISAGLGHTSQLTTEIYLARIENEVIDSANHEIIKNL